ncbi:flagellar hook-length control protein FliK [Caproiciproducens sp. NJN-50]|uniref:flagellar hook-length control protein FliK n=1 Tax=Acutalibacteraceae TaxID=3082771 RepID=UPI000FFDFED7|nr:MULTISPECIES: flagellar hook-length control protein FliK [Acutalibacteraceae]QAT50688.1 flagellar hook-length control protein FliK [Caproiciproducens sp. NJN-50]
MVQQIISTVNANVPSTGQTSRGTQDTDQFRSMLKAAAGQSGSTQGAGGSARKTADQEQDSKADKAGSGRKKERTAEADQSAPAGTNAGQAPQSALPSETLVSPDAAAAFASVKGQPAFQGKDQPAAGPGGSASDGTGAVLAAGIPPQEQAGRPGQTGQAFPPEGETARVSGQDSASPRTADRTVSEPPAQNDGISGQQASAPADSGRREFQSPDFRRQVAASAPGSYDRETRGPSDAQRDSRTTGAEGKNAAEDGTAQPLQGAAGPAQTHPPDAKDSGTGGAAAANGGLPALYGNGKVVIKVSGEPAQAETSPSRQVADAAVHQLRSGKTEFQMDLYPKSLGKVSVKLTSQDGLLTVEIAAADPKTQSLLLSGSSEIRSILQASTGQNVQTVTPDQQAAQWYGQQSDGGDASGNRRQKRDEPRRDKSNGVESVSAELNTGDFLSMIQRIGAYAR